MLYQQKQKTKIMKVKSIFSMLFSSTILAGTMLCLSSCDKDDDVVVEPNTIVKVATDNGFTTLVSAVQTAGLEATLKSAGPFTVFAPSNTAFGAITVPSDPSVLRNILLYHTLGAKVEATQVNETALTYGVLTANTTDSVYVKRVGSNVFINGNQVQLANVQATNGVVHTLSSVLLPPTGNLVQVASAAGSGFDSLVVAVLYASSAGAGSEDLATALSGIKNATLFAPTNQAFRDLVTALGVARINQIPKATVVAVLKNHVLASRYFSTDIPNGSNTLPALAGTITLNKTTGVTVKGAGGSAANVTAVNVVAKNGCVIHVIDKVLLP
jgi:uncharacterized surface protein with fasciclin (FAS1) repeats